MTDWAEPEDFGGWGAYDPLVDEPEDLPAGARSIKPSVDAAAPQAIAPQATAPQVGTIVGGKEILPTAPGTGGEALHSRMARMRNWFPSGSFDVEAPRETDQPTAEAPRETDGSRVSQSLSDARTPEEAMHYVAERSVAQLSDLGSPVIQRYLQRLA